MQRESIEATSGILKVLGPSARDQTRRDNVVGNPLLNGIDFVEFVKGPSVYWLRVHFLNPLPTTSPTDFGLGSTYLNTIRIEGGVRIVGITVVQSQVPPPVKVVPAEQVIEIAVTAQGDFSKYWLSIGWNQQNDGSWAYNLPLVDRQFSVAPVNFRPGCPIDFDCACQAPPQAPDAPPPVIDYLAKDYESFRQLLLDYLAQVNPNWTETNAADLGITLLELLAYEGDYLSYFQDAVANEAFLETVRKRVSAKRHARLVDYTMHDGRNAWTYVQFQIDPNGSLPNGILPIGTQILTKVETPLLYQKAAPGPEITSSQLHWAKDPALTQVKAFETTASMRFDSQFNELRIHAWGNEEACLPVGTTVCHLYAVQNHSAIPSTLEVGDLLLLEEVKGPATGAPADANPYNRQVVTITRIGTVADVLYEAQLTNSDGLQINTNTGNPPLLLQEVAWAAADALTIPLTLSTVLTKGVVWGISVARGNVARADHGRTVCETIKLPQSVSDTNPYTPTLKHPQITMQSPYGSAGTPLQGLDQERTDLAVNVRCVVPAVQVTITDATGAVTPPVYPVPTLLESNEFDSSFVVDVDDDGVAWLRFGDDDYGRSLSGATGLQAKYRVGNGVIGNIGAEAIAHVVMPVAGLSPQPTFDNVRNPLPAQDGVDPETIAQVQQYAPAAFHSQFYRAVTEPDYVTLALTLDGVADAVAEFRWTGSWFTALIGISPTDSSNLTTEQSGLTVLDPTFALSVEDGLNNFKLAGYDLEIKAADYVPLDIEFHLCVNADHFRADVVQAVLLALSNGVLPNGQLGFFNPANFQFGQPVYLSRLYAAIQAVDGVDSADVLVFQRYGKLAQGELEAGVIQMGPWEIARLDNNINLKENGVLLIDADGGK